MRRPHLLDVVKLTSPVTTEGTDEDFDMPIVLEVGETGTIVEVFETPNEAFMVEFINDDGEAVALPILTADQFDVVVPWLAPVAEHVAG